MRSSRIHSFMMNGPAPMGLLAKPVGLAWIAVGDPMKAKRSVSRLAKPALGAASVILSVVASTTSMAVIVAAVARFGDALAGSCKRFQLKATAAASYGVPSLNLMFGFSLS